MHKAALNMQKHVHTKTFRLSPKRLAAAESLMLCFCVCVLLCVCVHVCVGGAKHCRLHSCKIIMSSLYIMDPGSHPYSQTKNTMRCSHMQTQTRKRHALSSRLQPNAQMSLPHTTHTSQHLLASRGGRWVINEVVFISWCVTSQDVPRLSSS